MKSVISKSVDNPSVPGSARQRGLGAAYLAAALTAILLSLTANGFAGVAEESASANTQVLQPAHQRLQQALQQWANQHLASASEQAPVYRFALRDKRLAIPDCDAFCHDPAGLSVVSRISLAVDAACRAAIGNADRQINPGIRERATQQSTAGSGVTAPWAYRERPIDSSCRLANHQGSTPSSAAKCLGKTRRRQLLRGAEFT